MCKGGKYTRRNNRSAVPSNVPIHRQSSSIKHGKSCCILYDVKLNYGRRWCRLVGNLLVTRQFYFEICFRIPLPLPQLLQKLLKNNFLTLTSPKSDFMSVKSPSVSTVRAFFILKSVFGHKNKKRVKSSSKICNTHIHRTIRTAQNLKQTILYE